MDEQTSEASYAAGRLANLFASWAVKDDWYGVEETARSLANELRTSTEESRTALGKTMLPQTLTSLLKAGLEGTGLLDERRSPAVLELLRVGANICMDHDENRGYLLEAGFPQTTLSILESFASQESKGHDPLQLSVLHLKIVKTAIGVLLNASLNYDPVQACLISLEAATTLLRLTSAIYPPGSWLKSSVNTEDDSEKWNLRTSVTDWSWRTISNLKENESNPVLWSAESLPLLVAPLRMFVPPFAPVPESIASDSALLSTLMASDVQVLEETSELVESLTLDAEEVRLAIGRGMTTTSANEESSLAAMLKFIKAGASPPFWSMVASDQAEYWHKAFGLCKASIVRAVVECTGEEKNLESLWDLTEQDGFVSTMVDWVRTQRKLTTPEFRDDLVICATLSLGNLVRREKYSTALVSAPVSLGPDLVALLQPELDMKVKHGILALLKHLAQGPSNRSVLGQDGVITGLVSCRIFDERADIADVVQMSAIGVAKHLCTNNVENAVALALSQGENQTSGMSLILDLVRRSNSIHVKSEGTRVLVNVVKSLCSPGGNLSDPQRQRATRAVINGLSATALAQLLGRSSKHPILINESVFSLLLMVLHPRGRTYVIDALLAPLPVEVGNDPHHQSSAPSGPSTAVDALATALNAPDKRVAPEIRMNICSLLLEIFKSDGTEGRTDEVKKIKSMTQEALESLAKSTDNMALADSARKALNV